ncbi:MAG: hypothetical protein A3B73_04330 [Omnitrophica WOR_2 bacterium RIFCSPHIGHO2_02_FULL_63_39]|nr:MAG: hypothetical protein A2Z92_00355 [Omnitrophica WOR_2 bacterium GWA2_63_20]OGX36095.1 MAG: hypothetical protein A3B73_04330 [Omnitrophica WOR_2 bacterium RIFCSPHIGHO2_02_FULL_63_39]OGX48999.1 MAG: hypothetical protein A3G88_04930 [Omnitrophica WOR_2 bacterium RIFCSPLOWO2_12_FULL_63_16]
MELGEGISHGTTGLGHEEEAGEPQGVDGLVIETMHDLDGERERWGGRRRHYDACGDFPAGEAFAGEDLPAAGVAWVA